MLGFVGVCGCRSSFGFLFWCLLVCVVLVVVSFRLIFSVIWLLVLVWCCVFGAPCEFVAVLETSFW